MAAAESQSLSTYLPVLVQVALGLSIPAIILAASHLFGQRAKGNYIKDKAYECGLPMEGKPHPRFAVKFYVTAMLFILFDIEVVFLVPWALVYREFLAAGIAITAATAVFLGVLVLGLAYEFKRGALEWEK
ncbi:MAG: NADH-quinone oxidoreductase subunit A [Opitutales bacterium]|jgi:NADH-quinone oxidoreductase subunit A|nr:NADH-quinone oxidoreductase subunit A [Opitutales bacterium]MDP4659124.1 NADH-quinone oxidoreductase subunit A [Opitutales bacterium]MDP4775403.1 NADH-quinone oxidoreductase subunit A [Opitutales bacterium]MDP4787368.1 NADH-quinone oxidoreductase subunit A [Opitutales bacterium]MDP4860641.1 NADH-quinone oxidoreductase subunit A [Opitutales bacterium]